MLWTVKASTKSPSPSQIHLFISKPTIMLLRDGINQILVRVSNNPMAVLVQFNGRFLISLVGSKIENIYIYLIAFKLFY
jgi:hypothetical protein